MVNKIKTAFHIVFENKFYIFIAVVSAIVMALLYLFASQTITFFHDGIFFEFNLIRIITLATISTLFGIVIAMQVFFLRISTLRVKETGAAAGGMLTGMLAMSCCAPVLPSVLVLFGFSGTFLLSTTAFFGKYLLYFAALSTGLLLLSVVVLSRSLTSVCKVNVKKK